MSHHGRVESAGHEENVANTGTVLLFVVFMFFLIGISLVLVSLNLKLLAVTQPDRVPANAPDVTHLPHRVVTWAQPTMELPIVRDAQNANLAGYGWIDPSKGVVRIPIERAMELTASAPATKSTMKSTGVNP